MDSGLVINWDEKALLRAIGKDPEVRSKIKSYAAKKAEAANAASASFRTEKFFRGGKRVAGVGEKQPEYESDMQVFKGYWPVGIVYTGNYAAMKDNHLHNTLLKV